MLIDSHAHLDLYDEDRETVLARAAEAGVGTILAIGIGDGPETMQRALEIAAARSLTLPDSLPRIFATAGIHPDEAASASPEALDRLARLLEDPLCLAVGEIGLDYYHAENPDPEVQQKAFVAQMRLAAEARKPIVIHCRTSELATAQAKQRFGTADAWEDLLLLIEQHWRRHGLPGIMHCFSGTAEQAKRSVTAGFYVSFAGNLTYPKAQGSAMQRWKSPWTAFWWRPTLPFWRPCRTVANGMSLLAFASRQAFLRSFAVSLLTSSPPSRAGTSSGSFRQRGPERPDAWNGDGIIRLKGTRTQNHGS